MMLQEAIELIQQTAVKAAGAEIIPIDNDGRMEAVSIGGEIREIAVSPPLRKHIVHTLDDIINYVKTGSNHDHVDKYRPWHCPKHDPVVWHGENTVTLILDDGNRRDSATFLLTKSDKFQTLGKLANEQPWLDQKSFIRLLRFHLGLDNVKVVAPFRRLQWETGAKVDSQVNRGDARIGKSIIETVEGVDQLPDEIDVPTPVYSESGEREEYLVRCDIEIDAANQRFQLVPLPDELVRIVDLAQASIRRRLESSLQCPIYYGNP